MNKKYLTLVGRIRNELEEIEEIVNKINQGWKKYNNHNDDLYLDSVALNLHDYYSAIERIFEMIANEMEESLPEGSSWHKELIKQMTIEINNVRPAVISKSTEAKLDEYRGFRHVVRNVYSYKFSSEKIGRLFEKLDVLNKKMTSEINKFIDFLEKAGEV